jgi:hypothetical protein
VHSCTLKVASIRPILPNRPEAVSSAPLLHSKSQQLTDLCDFFLQRESPELMWWTAPAPGIEVP